MQDEEVGEKISETETEKPPEEGVKEPEPEKEPEHDAVAPGGVCKLCGWTFGDPVKGISPHIVTFGASRNEPVPVVEPKKSTMKESDPAACPPVAMQGKCPKCGWSSSDPDEGVRSKAHPILL
jgi:hypothetical protein